jgi:hypothetical protein
VVNPISERSGLLSIIKGVSARPTQGSHRYVICRRRRIITQNEYRPFLPPRVGTCMALLRERFFFAFASTPQSFVSGPSQTRDGESPTNPWPARLPPGPAISARERFFTAGLLRAATGRRPEERLSPSFQFASQKRARRLEIRRAREKGGNANPRMPPRVCTEEASSETVNEW